MKPASNKLCGINLYDILHVFSGGVISHTVFHKSHVLFPLSCSADSEQIHHRMLAVLHNLCVIKEHRVHSLHQAAASWVAIASCAACIKGCSW